MVVRLTLLYHALFKQVYRAYDTRFRYTSRRPDLYAKFAPPKEGDVAGTTEPDVTVVCRISDLDCDSSRGSGEIGIALLDDRRRVDRVRDKMDWMWSFRGPRLLGELLVVKIPYIKGEHFARNPMDFVEVIRFLQKMHEEGYVHGDVRAFNMIIRKGLIDFDYGGSIEQGRTYPPGYRDDLPDGFRLGVEEKVITTWHDWYALIKVVFKVHEVKPPTIALTDLQELVQKEALSQRLDEFVLLLEEHGDGCPEPTPEAQKELPDKLVKFLKDAQDSDWKIKLDDRFKASLKKFGYLTPDGAERDQAIEVTPQCRREATGPGTSSPPDRTPLFKLGK
jgi:hypothetical protein